MTPDDLRIKAQSARAAEPRSAVQAACTLVLFGATGDLARRKLFPALFALEREGELGDGFAIVAFARRSYDDASFRAHVREELERFAKDAFEERAWERFARRLGYVRGEVDDAEAYRRLASRIATCAERSALFYMALPPAIFRPVLEGLGSAGLLERDRGAAPRARVVLEKPFGDDLASAEALNAFVAERLHESQVYRIDHYLGKETVQNILVFRLGNAIFEHLWDRKYIDHVQITAAESIDIEGRGAFYDETGVVRDVLQNHLLQVLALIAMEPPVDWKAESIRNEKVKVLQALRPLDPEEDPWVLGQYDGYRTEEGVARDSRTPTYVAVRARVDDWRWQGVPFYLRAGKALAARWTEVAVTFRSVPLCLFGRDDVCARIEPNVLVLRLQPDEGIELHFGTKIPGQDLGVARAVMDFSYDEAFATPSPDAYTRLLGDALRGEQTLFARRDEIELAWRFVSPMLAATERDGALEAYGRGSDGPERAAQWMRRDGRQWRRPWNASRPG